jgi:hypothetical protein
MLSVRFLIAGRCSTAGRPGAATSRPAAGRRQWTAAAVVGRLLLVVDTGSVAWAEQRHSPPGSRRFSSRRYRSSSRCSTRVFLRIRLGFPPWRDLVGLVGVALLVGPGGSLDALGAGVILVASLAPGRRARSMPESRRCPRTALSAAADALRGRPALGAGVAMGELSRVHLGISAASLGAVGFLIVFGRSSRSPRTPGC